MMLKFLRFAQVVTTAERGKRNVMAGAPVVAALPNISRRLKLIGMKLYYGSCLDTGLPSKNKARDMSRKENTSLRREELLPCGRSRQTMAN